MMQHGGNKSGNKSNVWVNNTNLAKTVAALDEFKSGFPSNGLTTVSNKWWGTTMSEKKDGDVKDEAATVACEEEKSSLVAIRKRIAEEGREAIELGMHGSKIIDKRDQDLLFMIFKSDFTGSS